MKTNMGRRFRFCGVWIHLVSILAAGACFGQAKQDQPAAASETKMNGATAESVTIAVDEAPIVQVLNAFSRQTGRSIVIGPEVTGKVTARLSNIPWRDALEILLRPYGFGYYLVGDTVLIGALDKLPKAPVAGPAPAGTPPAPPPEPVVVKVFNLKYLDASDVEEFVKAQLSPQGKTGRLIVRGQTWKQETQWGGSGGSGGGGSGTGASGAGDLGRLKRVSEDSSIVKGKTLVVVDVQSSIDRIAQAIEAMDKMQDQILIEAKFIEVRADLLRDLGVEWGTGANGASAPGVKTIGTTDGKNLFQAGAQQISGGVKPQNFASDSSLSATLPFNGGLSVAFRQLTDMQVEVLLHLLQEDSSYKVISSPRILTANNQDATIIVGEKYPIIQSQTTSAAGGTPSTSTSLQYYENIGVQLKVLPQISDDKFINLIVHPSVREKKSEISGIVGNGGAQGSVSLTPYPVLTTREAETQVLMKSGQTVIIGGMLRDVKTVDQIKVPVLGSIPLLGMLFRRETVNNQQTELVIFIKATIQSPSGDAMYSKPSAEAAVGRKKAGDFPLMPEVTAGQE